jgi:hypothetical protein
VRIGGCIADVAKAGKTIARRDNHELLGHQRLLFDHAAACVPQKGLQRCILRRSYPSVSWAEERCVGDGG